MLHQERTRLLESAPLAIKARLIDPTPSSSELVQIMLGTCWIEDDDYCIEFLQKLRTIRANKLLVIHMVP